jgi:universal stress protein A
MKGYKNILVAVDFHAKSNRVLLEKVKGVAASGAKITLVHAVEELTGMVTAAYAVAGLAEIEENFLAEAKAHLTKICQKAKLTSAKRNVVKVGVARNIILEQAKKMKADLIMVGSHGRHGFRGLLGSTANAVLHDAHCDVLAIRVKD